MKSIRTALAALTLSAAAATGLAAAPAQAAVPTQAASSVYIGVLPGLTDCNFMGNDGTSKGIFASFTCTAGWAGYSLHVTGTPGTLTTAQPIGSPTSLAECQSRGNNGVNGGIWPSYTCRSGWAGYSLNVR